MKKLNVDKSNAIVVVMAPSAGYVCAYCKEAKWLICPADNMGSGICSDCAVQIEELIEENTPFEGQV